MATTAPPNIDYKSVDFFGSCSFAATHAVVIIVVVVVLIAKPANRLRSLLRCPLHICFDCHKSGSIIAIFFAIKQTKKMSKKKKKCNTTMQQQHATMMSMLMSTHHNMKRLIELSLIHLTLVDRMFIIVASKTATQ